MQNRSNGDLSPKSKQVVRSLVKEASLIESEAQRVNLKINAIVTRVNTKFTPNDLCVTLIGFSPSGRKTDICKQDFSKN